MCTHVYTYISLCVQDTCFCSIPGQADGPSSVDIARELHVAAAGLKRLDTTQLEASVLEWAELGLDSKLS